MASSNAPVVEVEHLSTRFGHHVVHDDVNFRLLQGEILGVVGASGSGKTTLLRQVLGLQPTQQGSIRILGVQWGEANSRLCRRLRNRCGVMYQGGALFSALSVYDNVAFPLRELRVLDEDSIGCLVSKRLRMVDLEPDVAALLPAELSGGMIKRVALARALALDPELLFLDEPTSGLDPVGTEHFVQLVERLHPELGFSLFMITHELDTLVRLCNRVAVLADKWVVASGTVDEVRRCPHPFVQDFFNGPRGRRLFAHMEARHE